VEETGVPGENYRPVIKSLTNFITWSCISPWARFEPTTLVVISIDCTGSWYHTITTTTAPMNCQWHYLLKWCAFLDQPCVYHGKLYISTFPPHKMMPMFFILGSICLSLSDMAAATVAPAAASTTSWKWRTIILDKQQIQGWQINYWHHFMWGKCWYKQFTMVPTLLIKEGGNQWSSFQFKVALE
jgi:hypothetical protein